VPDSVLVIDDNPDNVVLIRILLECEGVEVATAEDALQALEILKTRRPTLILMDIQLPGMDGLELTRHLRRNSEFAGLRIVALTAYAMKADEEEARAAGCDGLHHQADRHAHVLRPGTCLHQGLGKPGSGFRRARRVTQ